MSSNFIDISVDTHKVTYTNIGYRKNHSKNGTYIDGIHQELYRVLSEQVINDIKQNVGDTRAIETSIPTTLDKVALDEVGIGIQELNYNVAKEILSVAQDLCPVRTGALRRSGRIVHQGGNKYAVVFGGGDTGVNYAWYVEEFTWNNIISEGNPRGQHKFLYTASILVARSLGINIRGLS